LGLRTSGDAGDFLGDAHDLVDAVSANCTYFSLIHISRYLWLPLQHVWGL